MMLSLPGIDVMLTSFDANLHPGDRSPVLCTGVHAHPQKLISYTQSLMLTHYILMLTIYGPLALGVCLTSYVDFTAHKPEVSVRGGEHQVGIWRRTSGGYLEVNIRWVSGGEHQVGIWR